MKPGSDEVNSNVMSLPDAAAETILTVGGVVSGGGSTAHAAIAVAPVFPATSRARTANRCTPCASVRYTAGLEHAANASPSRRHANVAPASLALKVNEASLLVVSEGGRVRIVTVGATRSISAVVAGSTGTAVVVFGGVRIGAVVAA